MIERGLSVRATERLVSSIVSPDGRRKPGPSPAMQRMADRVGSKLGTKVRIEGRGRSGRGRLVIEYASRDELDRLVETLGA